MGNAQTSRNYATAAIAKYMSLSKHQVIQLHDACQQLSKPFNRTTFKRKHFTAALNQAQIDNEIDRDILSCLCTMWDLTGDGYVPYHEFSVGLAPLACPGESISTVLSFALQMMDQDGLGEISAKQMIVMLKSLNATATYFGDDFMGLRQIYKVVDNVFDTMTVVDDNGETLLHYEAISKLVEQPPVRRLFATAPSEPHSDSDNNNSLLASSHDEKKPVARREMPIARPFVKTRLEEASTRTEVSSVMLSPLVEVPVHSFANSTVTKTTYSNPGMVM